MREAAPLETRDEAEEPNGYPPPQHLLRDLRIVVERELGGSPVGPGVTGSIELVPEMLDESGRVRTGVVATLVDVAAGEAAIRAIRPSWTATSDLRLDVGELPGQGVIEARPRVLHHGRQSIVLEVDLRHRESRRNLGLATLGFAVLRARSAIQKSGHWAETPEPRTEFGLPESHLPKPLLDVLGVERDGDRPSIARLPLSPYLVNSLAAMQGGAIAILADATAERHAAASLGGPVAVRSLAVHYLTLARVGPVRAETRTLAPLAAGSLVRVELRDEGRSDALTTVATALVERAD